MPTQGTQSLHTDIAKGGQRGYITPSTTAVVQQQAQQQTQGKKVAFWRRLHMAKP